MEPRKDVPQAAHWMAKGIIILVLTAAHLGAFWLLFSFGKSVWFAEHLGNVLAFVLSAAMAYSLRYWIALTLSYTHFYPPPGVPWVSAQQAAFGDRNQWPVRAERLLEDPERAQQAAKYFLSEAQTLALWAAYLDRRVDLQGEPRTSAHFVSAHHAFVVVGKLRTAFGMEPLKSEQQEF